MRKKSLLALLAFATFAAAAVVGMGTSAAFAGEVTGNCNHATNDQSASNCKDEFSNGNSWCRFSGQNDNPGSTDPANPGGNTQNWGQLVNSGAVDPSTIKGGDPSPGTACNQNKPGAGGLPTETPPRK
jgi:hypothetical protein